MCYEATRNLPLIDVDVETPVATAHCKKLSGKKLAIVPVLRAGLGMVDNMVELIPPQKSATSASTRDPETHKPVEYTASCPTTSPTGCFVVDPMLATGGSAVAAIDLPEKARLPEHHHDEHYRLPGGRGGRAEGPPRWEMYLAAVDEKLNENAYIIPAWATQATAFSERKSKPLPGRKFGSGIILIREKRREKSGCRGGTQYRFLRVGAVACPARWNFIRRSGGAYSSPVGGGCLPAKAD